MTLRFVLVLSTTLYGVVFANDSKTRCYKTYCYSMVNEGVNYSSIAECTPPYQYLEIYDEEMMNDVISFAHEIDARVNFVELRLDCESDVCYWRDSKTRAKYRVHQVTNMTKNPELEEVLVILLRLNYNWLYKPIQGIKYSTICMKQIHKDPEMSHPNPTSDPRILSIPTLRKEEVTVSKTSSNGTQIRDCTMELLMFIVVSGVFHLMALITIVALVASRKKTRSYNMKKMNDSENERQNEKVQDDSKYDKSPIQNLITEDNDELSDYANLNQPKN